MRIALAALIVSGCTSSGLTAREQLIVDVLAAENHAWAQRDPELMAMKLRKMQRGPFEWLRGTEGVYWRDVYDPGAMRQATEFGDEASSRVLLLGDPHPENIGTFRAADGTVLVDWNDFDAAGYGPFEVDLRRLATGVVIAAADDALADELVRLIAAGYVADVFLYRHPVLELGVIGARGGSFTIS